MTEDVIYGDAEPTEYQRGFIDGIEGGQGAATFARRAEALKRAIEAHATCTGLVQDRDHITRSDRIIKAATMFERYLAEGK